MKDLWQTWYGQTQTPRRKTSQYHLGKDNPSPILTFSSNNHPSSGAGYTFGSGVVHKFLQENNMNHILRAHQLCMEGYSSLFDKHLSTVWSAPNYCYRCGNSASILEVSPGGSMFFNVFEAAPENDRDGLIQHQQQQSGQGGPTPVRTISTFPQPKANALAASRVLPVIPIVVVCYVFLGLT